MKKISPILTLLICFLTPGTSESEGTWATQITPEITLEAIKIFRTNPTGADALGALLLVANFARESDEVMIDISPNYLPWEQGTLVPYLERIFLGAFIAGNIEYQLMNKIKENRPLDGVKLMLYSYQILKNRSKTNALNKFEKWLVLEKNDQLKKELMLK